MPKVPVFTAQLRGRKLTPAQWARVEKALDQWKTTVLAAAKRHPAKSYKLGVEQIQAYSDLIGDLRGATATTMFGGVGPTMKHGAEWAETYTLHELDDALNVYVGKLKDILLYGIRAGANPTEIAGKLYKATEDATVNWRLVARTEMVRANAAGRLRAIADMGYEQVWCPPHIGACKQCKRILENKVFALADVIDANNFGRAIRDWVACIPLHPQCRHAWLPYDADVHALAMEQFTAMEAAGLMDEQRLDEMFDSAGQLRPEFANVDFSTAKTAGSKYGIPGISSGTQHYVSGPEMDPFAEGLAVAVDAVRKSRAGALSPRSVAVPLDALRTDLYQRSPDPDKVLSMLNALRRGEELPPPKVSLRFDGTFWVMDGQHRVIARRMHGQETIACTVWQGLSWDEESNLCRAAIAKTWNAYSAGPGIEEIVAKAASSAPLLEQLVGPALAEDPALSNEDGWLATYAPAEQRLDPLLWDGARLRDDVALVIETWWARVAGADWRAFSHLYIRWDGAVRVVVDYPALRAIRKRWRRLADADLFFALVTAMSKAGVTELAPGYALAARLEPDQLIHATESWEWDLGAQTWGDVLPPFALQKTADTRLPRYRWDDAATPALHARLLGSDDYETWVGKADVGAFGRELRARLAGQATGTTIGWHVAPTAAREKILEHGLIEAQPNERWARYDAAKEPAGIYVWTNRRRAMKWATDLARLVGGARLARNDVWQVDLTGLQDSVRVDPVLGEQGAVYLTLPSLPASRMHLEATKTLDELLDVAKTVEPAAGAGVEHWITIHPNGPDDKGQPVLVRNNSDGTMSVIGGAGGNLNYLRLDPSRRISRKDSKAGAKDQAPDLNPGSAAPVSEEETTRQEAEREQQLETARGALTTAKGHQAEAEQRLRDFAQGELGIDLSDPKARRKMLARLRVSAMRTLSYGPVQARDRADGPDPDQLGEGTPRAPQTDDELADQQHQVASDASPEAEDGITRPPRPSVAMSAEQAQVLLDHLGDIRAIQKVASQHRRVIAGEKAPSDANQIDWSLGGQEGRDERRATALEQFARTELARDLLGRGDAQFRGKKGYDPRYRHAFLQGGYDTVDSFTHSILGHNLISRAAHDLLGVAGAAQLAAHAIQGERTGKDLQNVHAALTALTDEQERDVADRGLGRIKRAADLATTARLELAKSERGEGLFTTTMARSMASEKVQEAKRGLGMMIGGLEACSALKSALEQPVSKIKVGGFSTSAQVKEAAARAGVKLQAGEIVRAGAGSYALNIAPERLTGLVQPDQQADSGLRARLRNIRTGEGLDAEIQTARRGPGMADVLDENQAKGKLYLDSAGSGLLGFDPGVGKTHVAIASAMAKMAAEPNAGHRALIVAPTNMLDAWGDTIKAQGAGHTVAVVDKGSSKRKLADLTGDAHFTVVSYETLKGYRKDLERMTAAGEHTPHSIVITDELQKAKNDDTANYAGVESAVDLAVAHHGVSEPDSKGAAFYGLTGTPIEKDVSDLNSMRNLLRRARGQAPIDKATARRKSGKLGQDEHIARGDKVAQFRDGLDADLFRLTASDAGNALAEPTRTKHDAPLTPEHEESFKARVRGLNEQIAEYHRTKDTGSPSAMPAFGGRAALMDELYGREDSSLVKATVQAVAATGTFDFAGAPADHPEGNYAKGDHAGTYEHKHVVFGSNETSKALFGKGWNKPGATPGGMHKELEAKGIKVFVGHGSMSNAQNTANYKAFLAHKGKAVFLTNDKNNAGISLQFGDNRGTFQHGATHLHHFTKPINNATVQQREARILRKGAWAKPEYHSYSGGTPLEMRMEETLEREARTQDLAANAEQRVAGADTLRHKLSDAGVKAAA